MGDSKLHAVLSPSSASRWLACTQSARLEQQFPDTSGDAAKEGTLAHAIGELMLRKEIGLLKGKQYADAFKALVDSDKTGVDDKGEPVYKFYNAAMYEHAEQYCTFVLEQLSEARKHTSDAKLFIEQRLDITAYIPEGFGTGDAGIVADHTLTCIDLKYGKGVKVNAENNKQMMLYALGWLGEFDFVYDIKVVRMIIYQPRLDNYSHWEIPVSELNQWAEEELKPRAAMAFKGEGEFAPGDHCTFCKVRHQCKAKADFELEIAKYEFQDGVLLDDNAIVDILNRAASFIKWINGVTTYALAEAVNNNKKWPDYKLVEGKSNRVFANEPKVIETLLGANWPEDSIYNKKLIGMGDMEKLVGGKKHFETLLGAYVIKPPGKPALVPATDKRPEYNSVASASIDFAEESED